jgi:hypothetical protein
MIHVESESSGRTVKSQITVSKDLEKFFKYSTFYSQYDSKIGSDESIINIPALSIVLPLAWITGSDVYVEELDKTFFDSMNNLQQEYKQMYSKGPFKTRLVVDKMLDSKHAPEGTALLFSGGLDSTYSLYRNLHLNPKLIMIFGVWDIPLSLVKLQSKIKKQYLTFTNREGIKLQVIHTNALEMLNIGRIEHFFWRFDYGRARGYWTGLAYSLGHLGQIAPLIY